MDPNGVGASGERNTYRSIPSSAPSPAILHDSGKRNLSQPRLPTEVGQYSAHTGPGTAYR